MFKADLHCHSHFSDGRHSPEILLARTAESGVSHLAITDHDFITRTDNLSSATDIQLICGVEISCAWRNREVHIVGLFIDSESVPLNRLLKQQRQKRKQRFIAMDKKLQSNGIEGLHTYLKSLPCETWTRSHVAEFLVTRGHCRSWDKAFKNFLSLRGKAYVPIEWAALCEVVKLIREANGIAVVAHPGRYGLTRTKIEHLVSEFKEAGGEAIEGTYANVDPSIRKFLCELAIEENLYISAGSDFHTADRHWTDLGRFPRLDSAANKNAIWHHSRWHFQ